MQKIIFLFCCLFLTSLALQAAETRKVLYFSNSSGFEHSTVKSVDGKPSISDIAITDICKPAGIEVVCTKDGSVFDKDLSQYDAFLFQTSGELSKGAEGHPDWALTEKGWKNLLNAVRNGKGFVGFHPTTDSNRIGGNVYENSPKEQITEFTKFIGAEFTTHGEPQAAPVTVVGSSTEPSPFAWLAEKGERFTVFEEWYVHKNFADDIHVFAVLETAKMGGRQMEVYQRPPLPIIWGRAEGKGRVLYSALGHFDEYWQDKDCLPLVLQLIQAACGDIKVDLTPNIKTVTPGASVLKNPK
jgi:type 1 glutamine amidotransferase